MSEPTKIGKIIKRKEYDFLQKFPKTWTEKEKQKIAEYETAQKNQKISLPKDYFKKPEIKPIEQLNFAWLAKAFEMQFQFNEGKELRVNESNSEVLRLITQYFAKNKEFENFKDKKVALNRMDLRKGLLIIGGVGCGKTSMMRTFQSIGQRIMQKRNDSFMYFQMISCNSLVREFEGLEQREKEWFFERNLKGVKYFDDFGTEGDASNFGKVNLMKNILEERYLKGKKCHLSTNLMLEEIEEKYGFRVYDRIKEMFNVIVMSGESFRN